MEPAQGGHIEVPRLLRVIPELQVTVRKRLTFVMSEMGEVMFTGSNIQDALTYLQENEQTEAEVVDPSGVWELKYKHPLKESEAQLWLGQPRPS